MAFDADEDESGPFLVMEFVNGRDLASEVKNSGPLPLTDAVDRILQSRGDWNTPTTRGSSTETSNREISFAMWRVL